MGKAFSVTNTARWLPIVAGALVLVAQPATAAERTCAVAETAGEATVIHDGSQNAAQVGAELAASDLLRTGPSGRIDVACSDGTRVTLGPDTEINLGSLVGDVGLVSVHGVLVRADGVLIPPHA